jgi:hypothetical protein
VPEAQQRSVTIDAFINMQLLAQAAMDAGLDQTEEFGERVEFMKMQALRNLYVTDAIVGSITDEELESGYQTLVVGQHKAEEQIRTRKSVAASRFNPYTLSLKFSCRNWTSPMKASSITPPSLTITPSSR